RVDGLYVVVNGALEVYVPQTGGGSRLAGRVSAGETVGEAEVISGGNRSVTIVAARDTEVARLAVHTFEKLVARNPQVLRRIANVVIKRLEALQHSSGQTRARPKSFAIVPCTADIDAAQFATAFAACLRGQGRAELVLSTQGHEQTSHWFHRLERANDYVVYVTDSPQTKWTRLCLRHADCVLLLARSGSPARAWHTLETNLDPGASGHAAELVFLGQAAQAESTTQSWLNLNHVRRHHHVRGPTDVARLARLATGRALAVVLSGGGARGFAHIGVMRALQAAHLPVDAIGATSIGAIIGAGWAAGWSYAEMLERMRRAFVHRNPLGDYTLPFVSLVSGRRVGKLLRDEFGERCVEDLPLPYFCVSTNLTNGQAAVHRRGKLWLWLRASVAIPGVLPPVCTERHVYVDGATVNNLPVDVMRESLDGAILAVDAGADRMFETTAEISEVPAAWRLLSWLRHERRLNILQILLRSGTVNSTTATIAHRQLADVLLKPALERIDMLDWKAFDRVVELGYRHACESLETHGQELQRRVAGP
ncbi:MAG: patatin-like phospholipase family protein, partial [Gammaproteobacteria bacterium]|nr:patatin-like phospholipase family protein [Gammaproteobacteria bacterium]